MKLPPEEPEAGPWRAVSMAELVRLVVPEPRTSGRPWLLAVDGRGGSGKTSLVERLRGAVPDSAVVHTDDVAWHHSFFDWSELLVDGVLRPLRRGGAVRYRPPGWEAKGRPGAIEWPAGLRLVVVEGTGAARAELAPWIDRSIWVQADLDEAERRAIAREGGDRAAIAFWREWSSQELEFLRRDRPWTRADVVVNGTPRQPHDAAHVLIGQALP